MSLVTLLKEGVDMPDDDLVTMNFQSLMPNVDLKTGIHYGCISQNSIDQNCLSDLIDESDDLIYIESKDNFRNDLINAVQKVLDANYIENVSADDINFDDILDEWNESYTNDNHHYLFDDGEYKLDFSDDMNCIIIIKSPYYTFCKQCSPCVPNAGDLDEPVTPDEYELKKGSYTSIKKAYCLHQGFFENDKAPYEYFGVRE